MIWTMLAILWLLFALFLCVGLVITRRGARVLGVTFAAGQARSPEVNGVVRTYKIGLAAVFVLMAACSFLLLLPAVGAYAEICALLLVVIDMLLTGLVQSAARRRLLSLRAEKGWIPPVRTTVTVDLQASRDKIKGAVTPVVVWVCFALSFVPAAVLLAVPELRVNFPLSFALICPICQLSTVYMYYRMRDLPARQAGTDTAARTAFAQKSIRIHTASTTAVAVSMTVFWLLFILSVAVLKNIYAALGAVALMFAVDMAAAFWQQRKLRQLEDACLDAPEEEAPAPEPGYKWGCYYDPADPRIFVPKSVESLGWTINIGRPVGKVIFAGIFVLIGAVIAAVVWMGTGGFNLTVTDTRIEMDAPAYDLTVARDQVESVELVDSLPANGTRTNGYGGITKSYGRFHFDGYGACMMYVYNDADAYIQLKLTGEDPAYVFLSGETHSDTAALYEELLQWFEAK